MTVHIPPVLVLIVCKVAIAGAPDQNAEFTGAQNLEWATENSMMTCRRNEVQLYDPAEGMQINPTDDPAPPLNPDFAQGAAMRAGRNPACDQLGSGAPEHALARVAGRLPSSHCRYADRHGNRLQTSRVQPSRYRCLRDG